jgi:hypothetical protein
MRVRSSSSFKSLQQIPSRRSFLSHFAGSGGLSAALEFRGHTGGFVAMFASLFCKETVPVEVDSEAIEMLKFYKQVATE